MRLRKGISNREKREDKGRKACETSVSINLRDAFKNKLPRKGNGS